MLSRHRADITSRCIKATPPPQQGGGRKNYEKRTDKQTAERISEPKCLCRFALIQFDSSRVESNRVKSSQVELSSLVYIGLV